MPKVYEYNQVRPDSRAQTLDSFLISPSPYSISESSTHKRVKLGAGDDMDDTEMDENESMADVNDGGDNNASGSLLSKIDQFSNNRVRKTGDPGSNTH